MTFTWKQVKCIANKWSVSLNGWFGEMVCDNDAISVSNPATSVDSEGIHLSTDTASLVLALRGFDRHLVNRLISGSVNCFSMLPRCLLAEEKRQAVESETLGQAFLLLHSHWYLASLHHDISTVKGDRSCFQKFLSTFTHPCSDSVVVLCTTMQTHGGHSPLAAGKQIKKKGRERCWYLYPHTCSIHFLPHYHPIMTLTTSQ